MRRPRRARARRGAGSECLERERRRDLQLLCLAPRRAHELARTLGAEQALVRRVLAQLGEAVDMDGRALGARRDDDEVAVPPLELLEQREQLLALGAALRPADPLLRLAPGSSSVSMCASAAAFASAPRSRSRREGLGRGARCRSPARCRRRARRGSVPRAGAPQPGSRSWSARPSRPPAVRASVAISASLRPARVRRDRLAQRRLGETPERDELAARADRLRQRAEPFGDEDDDRVRRRLLEILQERVGRVLVERVGAEDEVDAPVGLERPHVEVAPQLADVVDADLLAERLENVEVGMAAARDARLVAEQLAREPPRELPLPDARRAVEEVRMAGPSASAAESSRFASCCSGTLSKALTDLVSAISSAGRSAFTVTILSGNRSASCAVARRRPAC